MKFTTTSAALALAIATSVAAAPATVETGLSKREADQFNLIIADMDHLTAKRDLMAQEDIAKREYAIVTQILQAISNSGLAPKIIDGLVSDPTLGPIVANAIVAILKSGLINLTTLLKALVDSGIINSVIQGLISDCNFYAEIYKIALSYIGDLAKLIGSKLGLSKRELLEGSPTLSSEEFGLEKRATASASVSASDDGIVANLLDSLKKSGLATSVVKALITDKSFLTWGASLIQKIIQQKALTLTQLLDAIKGSGLVPSLFQQFFNFDTLKTVTVNALAAAFGQCDGASVTSSATVPGTVTPLPTSGGGNTAVPTTTPTGTPSNCKRRRRSYNY
ncbi:hypothetical protein CAAN3_07S01750 [[Candida] anglica]